MNRPLVTAPLLSLLLFAAPRPAAASDVRANSTDPGSPVLEIPFEITSNKPFVRVRVNGSTPRWFILDTGCRITSLIARECAEELGLKLAERESEVSMGAGAGKSLDLATTRNVTIDVQGVTLQAPELPVVSLAHVMPYEGRRVDGLLGGDFMEQHVVELDYAHTTLRVYDPETYRYAGTSTPIPITIDDGLVRAPVRMVTPKGDTLDCRVVIDTGVRGTVVWYHPFVVEHRLLDSQERHITGTDAAGILGGELLRRCKVIFDYPHDRLILEPCPDHTRDLEYDMSGLFLVADAPELKRLRVQSVAAGTPAAEAGLEKGDQIVTIDGRGTDTLSLDQVREMFKKAGTTYRLGVARGEQQFSVRLEVRRLV